MYFKKLVSVVLCLALLMASAIALFPEMKIDVSAATYVTGANPASDSYKTSKYYKNFLQIPLTGDGRTDVLAIALSQLGYKESDTESNMTGIVEGSGNNYTEFNYNMGDWGSGYGGVNWAWCASFVSWSLLQSGCTTQKSISDWSRYHMGEADYIWREVSCPYWANQLRQNGYFQDSKYLGGDYQPQSGDLIFFSSDGDGESHIGIVVYSDSSKVYTVEGNTSDQSGLEPEGNGVYFKNYTLGDSYITGYGVLPYKTNSNIVKIDYSGAAPSTGLYISDREKYVYPSETSDTRSTIMPRFTMFEVTELASNGRLKVAYTDDNGKTVTGYILNNTDRVIQITSNVTNEKVSMTLKCVDEAGTTLKTETLTGYKGASVIVTPPAINGYTCTQTSVVAVYANGATVTLTYKTTLDATIEAAGVTRYCDYTPSALATLRSVYDQAVAMQKNSSATFEDKIQMATQLQNAINNDIYQETIVSEGKTYTTSASNRDASDKWYDDGKRLTDGNKGNKGDTLGFSGWNVGAKGTAEVVIDLGANATSSVYRVYVGVSSDWGISVPIQFTVSVSNDNKTFTQIGNTDSETKTVDHGVWTNYYMTVRADSVRTERYVKFAVEGVTHVWLEEVEVASAGIGAKDEIYVDGINTKVTNGKTVVFTPAFGDITVAKANHKDTSNIVAAWSASDNCYIVKSVTKGKGDSTPTIKLASDEIFIAAHSWEVNVTDPVFYSENNVAKLKNVALGDKLYLNNVNVSAGILGATATVALISQGGKPVPTEPINVALGKGYTGGAVSTAGGYSANLTDGNANNVGAFDSTWYALYYHKDATADKITAPDGIGTIIIDLNKVVGDITDVRVHVWNCNASGILPAKSITLFVSEDGKTYTEIGELDIPEGNDPDWATISTDNISARYVKLVVETQAVWTFLNEIEVFAIPNEASNDDKLGDVDSDGDVDAADYILVKRAVLKTYALTDEQFDVADIDKDGDVDAADYVLVKRIVLGTYSVE